jgi:DNA topoisomerase-1
MGEIALGARRGSASHTAVGARADIESAELAGLRYAIDTQPGIRRHRVGSGFVYFDAAGKRLRNPHDLARIRSIVIPPAWTEVWICPRSDGHLQAVGRDARGRKQYRYHPRWRVVRDRTKYDHMVAFAKALPGIRRRVRADLRRSELPREKVLAAVVQLLESTQIRIGNEEYARENRSYGLTTLRDRHVEVSSTRLRFRFRGKSGKMREIAITDRRLARIVRRCQEIPGQELFQYIDEQGETRSVDSGDVNAYLREISGADFTAKDFRTWAGTVLACAALRRLAPARTKNEARKNVVRAIAEVAERLGNTPAVCRKAYIHPRVFDRYLEAYAAGLTVRSAVFPAAGKTSSRRASTRLDIDEAAIVRLLRAPRRQQQPAAFGA